MRFVLYDTHCAFSFFLPFFPPSVGLTHIRTRSADVDDASCVKRSETCIEIMKKVKIKSILFEHDPSKPLGVHLVDFVAKNYTGSADDRGGVVLKKAHIHPNPSSESPIIPRGTKKIKRKSA